MGLSQQGDRQGGDPLHLLLYQLTDRLRLRLRALHDQLVVDL